MAVAKAILIRMIKSLHFKNQFLACSYKVGDILRQGEYDSVDEIEISVFKRWGSQGGQMIADV